MLLNSLFILPHVNPAAQTKASFIYYKDETTDILHLRQMLNFSIILTKSKTISNSTIQT